MNFGQALELLKSGVAVRRMGWNAPGQFVYLVPANSYPVQTGAARTFFGEGTMVPYDAYLALKNSHGTVSTWAPSCSDALAEDWSYA
jgi:hypothetical protein